ncbi:hypothetical protein T03_8789, partial [Trichinella britovi]
SSLRLRRGLRLRLFFFKFQKFSIFRTICPRLRPRRHAYGNFKKLFAFRSSLRLRRGLRLRLFFFKFQKFPIFRTICPRLRPRRRLRQF